MFKPKIKVNADKTVVTVTLSLKPVFERKHRLKYGTKDIRAWLLEQGYEIAGIIKKAVVLNYEGPARLNGTWEFSLSSGEKSLSTKSKRPSSKTSSKKARKTTSKK